MKNLFTFIIFFLYLGFAYSQPATQLPAGYSWVQSGGNMTYLNGPFYTGNASGNNSNTSCCSGGATMCGSSDTSFGGAVQCSSVPWSVVGTPGANFIQAQKYGNIGTCDNSLAGLAVVCNPGVGGTSAGANWPSSTTETRRVTLTNWNNTSPESAISGLPLGSRTSGTVWLPVSATLRFRDDGIGNGTGAGADEMRLTMIGGDNSSCSTWKIDASYNLSVAVSGAYGGVSGVNGTKINESISQTLSNVPNAGNSGSDNKYHATDNVNHSSGCGGFQSSQNSWYFPGGSNTSAVGTGFALGYNILSALVQNGATFTVDFTSAQSIAIDRTGGSSGDARATMGPGMGGKVELEVVYQVWTIQAPAPVTYLSFDVRKSSGASLLKWSTASELNNEGFFVQRSADGQDWTNIEFIKGNGNSSKNITYTYIDQTPVSGINYYRLGQKDFDGKIYYSDIKNIRFALGSDHRLFPNPTKGMLQMDTNYDAQYQVFSSDGKSLAQGLTGGNGQIDISHLPAGLYTVRIILNDEIIVNRVVKE